MPNMCVSLSPFFFCYCYLFLKKKIIELQHIVVFNLYKKQLLLFLEKKERLGTYETSLYPSVVSPDTQFILDFPGKDSHAFTNVNSFGEEGLRV